MARLLSKGMLKDTIVIGTTLRPEPPKLEVPEALTATRVPLYVSSTPAADRLITRYELVSLLDLAPTLLDLAEIEIATPLPGRTLSPLLRPEIEEVRDFTRRYVLINSCEGSAVWHGIRTAHHILLMRLPMTRHASAPVNHPAPTCDSAAFAVSNSPNRHRSSATPHMILYDLRTERVMINPEPAGPVLELQSLLESKLRAALDPCFPVHAYVPRSIRGWTLFIHTNLTEDASRLRQILDLLDDQLRHIERFVPLPARTYLQTVPIWLSPPYPNSRPKASIIRHERGCSRTIAIRPWPNASNSRTYPFSIKKFDACRSWLFMSSPMPITIRFLDLTIQRFDLFTSRRAEAADMRRSNDGVAKVRLSQNAIMP